MFWTQSNVLLFEDSCSIQGFNGLLCPFLATPDWFSWIQPSRTLKLFFRRRNRVTDEFDAMEICRGDFSNKHLLLISCWLFWFFGVFVAMSHSVLNISNYLEKLAGLVVVGLDKYCMVVPWQASIRNPISVARHCNLFIVSRRDMQWRGAVYWCTYLLVRRLCGYRQRGGAGQENWREKQGWGYSECNSLLSV